MHSTLSIMRTLSGSGNREQSRSCNMLALEDVEVRNILLDSPKTTESHLVSWILRQQCSLQSPLLSMDLLQRAVNLEQTSASSEHISPSIINQEFYHSWKSHQGIQAVQGCTMPCVAYSHFVVVHYIPWQ
jgi:hypothetical protein